MTQSYAYDSLNRLALAVENPADTVTASSSSCAGIAGTDWCQSYSDDIYGNNVMTSVNLGGFTAPAGYDATTNRISPNGDATGWHYDAAGDIDRDGANVTYAFDAEGRMTTACNPNGGTPTTCTSQWASGQTGYTYDGNGNRVQMNHQDGTTTTYVYDASGALAAEYGGPAQTGEMQYLVTDALGSTRLVYRAPAA